MNPSPQRRQLLQTVLAAGGLGLAGRAGAALARTSPSAAALDRVDAYAQQWLRDQQMPGLALALVQDGEPIYARGLGWADVGQQRPVTEDMRFAICSISKPLLCCAAQLMVEDGQLRLDQRLAGLFDGLPEAWQAITLRQLMQHTSGLP